MAVTQTSISKPARKRPPLGTYTVHTQFGATVRNAEDLPAAKVVPLDGHMFQSAVDTEGPRKIGYVRVSTTEQETAMQMAAMRWPVCDLIFEEKRSSVAVTRHALNAVLSELRPGDTLVVWKLDRLGRTTVELLSLIEDLEKRGVHFACVTQGFDTSTPMGKLMLGILAAFAEFERNTLVERTNAGLEAARAKGHFGGRRRSLTGEKLERALEAYRNRPIDPATGRPMTIEALAKMFGVSKPTLCRWALHGGMPTWGPDRARFLERNPDLVAWQERTADPLNGTNPAKDSRLRRNGDLGTWRNGWTRT